MMHMDRNVFLLRPLVRPRVVLIDQAGRTAAARTGRRCATASSRLCAGWIEAEAANDIELAVDHGAIELFLRLRKWRRFRPAHAARRWILCADRDADRQRDDGCERG